MNVHEISGKLLAIALRTLLPNLNDLEKENILLRYQLIVLQRQSSRPKFTSTDRNILCQLSLSFKGWKEALLILRPETLLKWHRQLAESKWTTNRSGRPPLDPSSKELIIRLKRENQLWGPKRIHGELIKLGVLVSETTCHVQAHVCLGHHGYSFQAIDISSRDDPSHCRMDRKSPQL